MKNIFKVVIIMCLSAILSFFGCGKNDRYILDGPGMENKPKWDSFTVSRSDSYAQYNFWFTVIENENGAFVTGECRDDDGTIYTEENGIPISKATLSELRSFNLDYFSDVKKESNNTDSEMIILDESIISLTLEYQVHGQIVTSVSADLSMQIFELLSPYLFKKFK